MKKRSSKEAVHVSETTAVVAPIDHWGVWGRRTRHGLLKLIDLGQPLLVALQKRRSPTMTKFMRMASMLGFEEFLTIFIIFLHVAIDARLSRLYCILMGAAFYVVGFAKGLLCLPRPRLPIIVPLEAALDWALPSNHAMMATCLPLYVWFYAYLHQAQLGLDSAHCLIVCGLMCTWSVLVMFSRLYLGVHSPADIVTGGILGGLLLSLYLQVDDQIDVFICQKGVEPILYYLILVVFLLSIFPSLDSTNPCCSDAVTLLGVVFGVICASKESNKALFSDYSILTASFWFRALFRLIVIGAFTLCVLKPMVKALVKSSVKSIYDFVGVEHYSGSEHIKEIKQKKDSLFRYSKHLQPSFSIPPVHLPIKQNRSETDILVEMSDKRFVPCTKWNHDLPIKFFVYSILQYAVCESTPTLEYLESAIFR